MFDNSRDGSLVKRCACREKARRTHVVGELLELRPLESRALEPLDVLDVFTALEVRMNERVKFSVLELDRGANIVSFKGPADFVNDPLSVGDTAVVVVRQI